MAARATAATVRVDLGRDQNALQARQCHRAFAQVQPQRRRLTGIRAAPLLMICCITVPSSPANSSSKEDLSAPSPVRPNPIGIKVSLGAG